MTNAQTDTSAARTEAGRHGLRVLAILSILMGFASLSTDLYLPAMPAMAMALHTNAGMIEFTVSGYLMGFAAGQLVWGPVSDRHGRRLPVAIGLVLFVIGSAGCALSAGAASIIGWRLVQALGASAGVTLGRAMVHDLYSGTRAASMLSTLLMVMAVAPLLGPLVGGQILVFASWRAIFWVLVGVGAVTLMAMLRFPETLPVERRNHEKLRHAFAAYPGFLGNRRIMAYAGAGGFYYAGTFAYIAGTPFAYIGYHHLSPQLYGFLFGANIIGLMIANLTNARLVARLGSDRLLRLGTGGAAFAGLLAAFAARTGFGGLAGLAGSMFIFVTMTGFIVANSIVGALASFSERAGAVSAFIGAFQYGSGIAGSALVGAFADGTPWPLGWVLALCGIGSFLSTYLLPKHQSPAQLR